MDETNLIKSPVGRIIRSISVDSTFRHTEHKQQELKNQNDTKITTALSLPEGKQNNNLKNRNTAQLWHDRTGDGGKRGTIRLCGTSEQ